MKRLMWLLVIFFLSFNAVGADQSEYINRIAPYPKFDILNSLGRAQITYSNGDQTNPEYFIITCDEVKQEMNVVYYVTQQGFQITNANYFTIQRYPRGWLKMAPPYHSPAAVIYDAGMAGEGKHLVSAIKGLLDEDEWGVVITLETFVNNRDIITQAWTDIIPSKIVKRDLTTADLSICEATKFNSILPLVSFSNENQ